MGLFKDLGECLDEIVSATGECADELTHIACGTARDIIIEETRPRKIRVKKVTRYIVEEEDDDLGSILFGRRYW